MSFEGRRKARLKSFAALWRMRNPRERVGKQKVRLMFRENPTNAVLVALGVGILLSLPREELPVQTTAKDLVGTWTLVSIKMSRTARKPIFLVPIRKAKRRARLTVRFRSSASVRIFQSSYPTIARQELQKKTRPSCRGALPTSA
jgi:hypothetical protein